MIKGIHHFALHSKNFEAMRRFYKEALGFEEVGPEASWQATPQGDAIIGVENASARTVTFKGINCFIELFEYWSPAPRDSGPAAPNDYGYTHFCLEVTDIQSEYERLKGHGMTFTATEPGDVGYLKSVYGRDPDGNVIELQEIVDCEPLEFEKLNVPRAEAQSDTALNEVS